MEDHSKIGMVGGILSGLLFGTLTEQDLEFRLLILQLLNEAGQCTLSELNCWIGDLLSDAGGDHGGDPNSGESVAAFVDGDGLRARKIFRSLQQIAGQDMRRLVDVIGLVIQGETGQSFDQRQHAFVLTDADGSVVKAFQGFHGGYILEQLLRSALLWNISDVQRHDGRPRRGPIFLGL